MRSREFSDVYTIHLSIRVRVHGQDYTLVILDLEGQSLQFVVYVVEGEIILGRDL